MAPSGSESERSRSPQRKPQPEGQDPNSCLYIGNIDKRVNEEQLRAAFEVHGELEYCFIVYEPQSGSGSFRGEPKQSRGYGFARYRNQDESDIAKKKMQGMDINGRRITVELSKRARPREPTPGRYLGKKRSSPPRRSSRGYRDSYSRSRSSSRSHRRHRHHRSSHHEKRRHRHYRSRSRSGSYRRHRDSYSRSPRR